MSAATHPRRTPGWYDIMLGAGCAVAVHLLAASLLLGQAPAAPVEMPRILQASLISAPVPTQPPAAQPPAPTATPPVPKPPQPQRRPAPKAAVVKRAVRNPVPVEPNQPVPPAIAPSTLAAPPTPPATAATPPVETVTEPRFDAAYLNNPGPAYPNMSRRLRAIGTVQLRVRVSAAGLPIEVLMAKSSGYARLDESAFAAVQKWKFQPATRSGNPVEAWVLVPIEFSLTRG